MRAIPIIGMTVVIGILALIVYQFIKNKMWRELFTVISIMMVLVSCKKEQQIVLVPGQQYHIRSDIFNKGAYQPQQPVQLIDLYTGPNGVPYSHCKAAVNWSVFALKDGNGIAALTVQGNQVLINQGLQVNDPSVITWYIPQYDLQ